MTAISDCNAQFCKQFYYTIYWTSKPIWAKSRYLASQKIDTYTEHRKMNTNIEHFTSED